MQSSRCITTDHLVVAVKPPLTHRRWVKASSFLFRVNHLLHKQSKCWPDCHGSGPHCPGYSPIHQHGSFPSPNRLVPLARPLWRSCIHPRTRVDTVRSAAMSRWVPPHDTATVSVHLQSRGSCAQCGLRSPHWDSRCALTSKYTEPQWRESES